MQLSKMYHVSAGRLLKVLPFVLILPLKAVPSPEHVQFLISIFVVAKSQYRSFCYKPTMFRKEATRSPQGLIFLGSFLYCFPSCPSFPIIRQYFQCCPKTQRLFSYVFRVESYLSFMSSALSLHTLYVSCFL